MQTLTQSVGRLHTGNAEQLPQGSVVVYAPPDAVLQSIKDTPSQSLEQLEQAYHHCTQWCRQHRVVARWRLLAKEPSAPPPVPEALCAAVVLRLIEQRPSLLHAYLDLELQAELAGGQPDSAYRQRLQQAASADALLHAWWNRSDPALAEVQEEAELTLLQLHQVQEELEHWFLKSRSEEALIQAQAELLSRAGSLVPRLATHQGLAGAGPSVQTLALLEGYRHSLKRAERLLVGGANR